MRIFWIDDDSPSEVRELNDATVVGIKSLGEAEARLASGDLIPDAAIVDLMVPQNGWGKNYLEVPGVEYIRHLRERFGDRVYLAAFSSFLTPERRRRLSASGAHSSFEKTKHSLWQVIESIKERKADERGLLLGGE